MVEFGASAELSISVPRSEVQSVRSQLERDLSDIEIGVSSAAPTGGGGAVGARGPEPAGIDISRRQLGQQEDLVDLAEQRNELLEELSEGGGVGGGGGGGIGPGTGFIAGRSLPGGGGGGFGLLGLLGLLGGTPGIVPPNTVPGSNVQAGDDQTLEQALQNQLGDPGTSLMRDITNALIDVMGIETVDPNPIPDIPETGGGEDFGVPGGGTDGVDFSELGPLTENAFSIEAFADVTAEGPSAQEVERQVQRKVDQLGRDLKRWLETQFGGSGARNLKFSETVSGTGFTSAATRSRGE